MTGQGQAKITAPSKSALAKATGIALLVALVLLFTAILPAEYGFDPLKTGSALRLTGIAQAGEVKGRAAPTPAPGQAGVYTPQTKTYKVDAQDFQLGPGEGVEMKYHMQKGAGLVYAWKANGKLMFEFHGEPDQKPNKDYFESYELDDKAVFLRLLYGALDRHSRLVLAEQGRQGRAIPPDGGRLLRFGQDVRGRQTGRRSGGRREVGPRQAGRPVLLSAISQVRVLPQALIRKTARHLSKNQELKALRRVD
jgi:hypothetical protein